MDYVFQSDYSSDPKERLLLVYLTEVIIFQSDMAKKYHHHH